MRLAWLCVIAVMLSGEASAQNPEILLRGQNYQTQAPVSAKSNSQGFLRATAHPAGFHWISLETSDADISSVYSCEVQYHDDSHDTSSEKINGERCPSADVGRPTKFIRALTFRLDGLGKENYVVRVRCRIDLFGRIDERWHEVGPGQRCGNSPSGPIEFLTEFELHVYRKP